MEELKICNVLCKCSYCGEVGLTSEEIFMGYPMTCGSCGKVGWTPIKELENKPTLEEFNVIRNKLNRKIATLKKAQLKK